MVMLISWDWIPGEALGPFRFGEEVDTVIRQYGLRKLDRGGPAEYWDTYEVPSYHSKVTVEGGKIASVLCEDAICFRKTDLLGLPLPQVREVLGQEDEFVENVGLGDAAYYHRLGLTLWVVNGVVDSATCELVGASDTRMG